MAKMRNGIGVVVNPQSNNRATMRRWPEIEKKLKQAVGDFEVEFTGATGEATQITRDFLKKDKAHIIAVGGDGTLSEVVNGFFDGTRSIAPEAIFSPVMMGRGNDFEKSLVPPKSRMYKNSTSLERSLSMIRSGAQRKIDVGRITYSADSGAEESRYFLNLTSCGMSGLVDRKVNASQSAKWLGGSGAFLLASLQSFIDYKVQKVDVCLDGEDKGVFDIRLLVVANGQFAGGGMWFAPQAELDDGEFDVILIQDSGGLDTVLQMPKLYSGEYLRADNVTIYKAKTIELKNITKQDEVLLDIDGESPGRLPAKIEMVPAALNIRYGL